jgi:DNA ligase (NAD+)
MNYKQNPDTRFKDVHELGKEEAREQIVALREGIEYHDYWYYVKNAPKISDATYDKLFRRLMDLEEAFPESAAEDSPTRRIGAEPMDKLEKVEHTSAMQSLNAVYDADEVEDFDRLVRRQINARTVTYVAEPKFDGLSIEVVYEGGAFVRGATRGDGYTGEDVSKNARTIRAVPLHLRDGSQQVPPFLAVRGEVFMCKEPFQELNKRRFQSGQEPFANPRNAAAGALRQLDPGKVADVPLDVFFYEVLDVRGLSLDSHWDTLDTLAAWGLKTDPHNRKCSGLKPIEEYRARLAEQRDTLGYQIDGIVIKVDDYRVRRTLGTRQRSPRWALAWKFAPRQEVTTLNEIVVQVGRTGMLTPVGLLEPVNVGGVTVSRATLHNEDEARRKDVRPGDRVRIERAGDVIPEVVERVPQSGRKRAGPFAMPKRCPACGTEVHREGAYCFCPASLSCPGQLIGKLTHYARREATDIDGLSEATARDLVDKQMVRTVADLYHLSVTDLQQLEGFAEKSARQLHAAIQRAKTPRMDRFVYALGIRQVGEHIAQVLARRFGTMEALQQADLSELNDIDEIGPEIARCIHRFFGRRENRAVLERLYEGGVQVKTMPRRGCEQPLEGKTFVFTGELNRFSRDDAQRVVEDLGGRATSSVSGNTDFIVVGENPGRKLDEAKKRNVKTIREKEFTELVHA